MVSRAERILPTFQIEESEPAAYTETMGENEVTRKQIRGLEQQIAAHHEKIAEELKRESPNYGVIGHWEKEIRAWSARVQRLQARLPGGR